MNASDRDARDKTQPDTPFRRRLYEVLESPDRKTPARRLADAGLTLLILFSVGLAVLGPENTPAPRLFAMIELAALIVFALEYVARLWVAAETARPGDGPWRRRLKFAISPMGVVDLLAVLPALLAPLLGFDLLFLRLLRLLRVFKLTRYSPALGTLTAVLVIERRTFAAVFLLIVTMALLAAGGLHAIEGEVQPEAFGTILKALWWAVVTITTIGYGDVVPITPAGKLFAGTFALLGIGLITLPATILAAGFLREMRRRDFMGNIRMIAISPTFQKLDSVAAAQLASSLELVQASPGDVVVAPGDPPDALYFIGAGQVACTENGETTERERGAFFGERELLMDEARTLKAVVQTPATLLRLDADDFRRLCQLIPTFREIMADAAIDHGGAPERFEF